MQTLINEPKNHNACTESSTALIQEVFGLVSGLGSSDPNSTLNIIIQYDCLSNILSWFIATQFH